jgi:pSer/pThr/pTyr-binding forkhead associated (FHA) protein
MGPLMPDDGVTDNAAAGRPVIDVLDRDGQVRQTFVVPHWPLRIGRALDNDVVLSDPHVAAHHLSIVDGESGLALSVADTVNGVQLGGRHLRRGEQAVLPTSGDAIALGLGRTHLRLRLPSHTLAPELADAVIAPLARRLAASVVAALVLLGSVLFGTYLAADPEGLTRAAGSALLGAFVGAALWCGFWAMLSKVFTRQAHFGWHVRVFLLSGLALMVLGVVPALLAFAFSWPWATDFSFVGEITVVAAALYFHLLAVEPARHRVLKWVAAVCAGVGIGLTLWFNVQRSDRFGDELYMTHLFPPALRVAKPISTDTFVNGLAPLKKTLDKKAREPARGDDTGAAEED